MTWRQLLKRRPRHEARRRAAPWARWRSPPTPRRMLKSGLVEGDTDAGVLAGGQVVGVIDDLPTCEELIDRIVSACGRRARVAPRPTRSVCSDEVCARRCPGSDLVERAKVGAAATSRRVERHRPQFHGGSGR